MKKRKLLTSLSSLGVLAAAAPIVATSCSSDNISYANGMIFDGKVYEIEKNCDLNSFCWVPTLFSTTEYFMSIKLANGDYFNITKDNKDKLTKLKITDINKSVKFIANDFLSDMPCLKSLEIGDYSHITEIGDRFLLANTLSTVDISTFTNVELIGDDFLAMSYNLTGPEIKDPTNGYQKLHTIGKHFIAGCPKFTTADLTSFNYSPIANLKIGEGMYSDCYNLKTVYAGKITPANMGYDTWVVEGTPAKWSLVRNETPTEDIETFTCWFLSDNISDEKYNALKFEVLCDDQTVVDAWKAAQPEGATPNRLNLLRNREWVDPLNKSIVMYGNRNFEVKVGQKQ